MAARSPDAARLAAVIAEVLHRHPAGGLAVGVVGRGGLEFFEGFGVADTARGTPITQDTVFRIGSISKTFTAIAVMQLRDRGLLDLDDPVGQHLRSYRLAAARRSSRPTTIRHLLTHTGGIGELRSLADLFRPTIGLALPRDRTAPSLADYYRGELRVEVEPGTKWAYANHGFATLGQLVEDVSGEPFASYMREHIFGPLGMGSTDFTRTAPIQDHLATGYALRKQGLKAVKDRDIAIQPAGSIFSTTADMARYAGALLGGDGGQEPFLRPEILAEMFSPQYRPDPRLPGIGLSFLRGDVGGHRTVGHDGGWPGFISTMVVAPDDGLAVLAFTNAGSVTPARVSDAVLREMLGVAADGPRLDVPEHPDVWAGSPTPGSACSWEPARRWSSVKATSCCAVSPRRRACARDSGCTRTTPPILTCSGSTSPTWASAPGRWRSAATATARWPRCIWGRCRCPWPSGPATATRPGWRRPGPGPRAWPARRPPCAPSRAAAEARAPGGHPA